MSKVVAALPPSVNTLHILNKTPGHPRATQCMAALTPGDTLLLIENGVLGAVEHTPCSPCPVFVLAADAGARGIAELSSSGGNKPMSMQWADYQHMVQLSALAKRIISW